VILFHCCPILHKAAADTAQAVHQLTALTAEEQPLSVLGLFCLYVFIQAIYILVHIPQKIFLRNILQQTFPAKALRIFLHALAH
jgi:hypothetical protein